MTTNIKANSYQGNYRATKKLALSATISKNSDLAAQFARSISLAGSLFVGIINTVNAQPEEVSYLNTACYNTKHYATSQQSNGTNLAMAGTLFNYNGIPGNNAVHFLGNSSPFTTSVVYDHPDFDERVVGVHYKNPGNIYIVSSAIDITVTPVPRRNGIEVIHHPSGSKKFIFSPVNPGRDYWPLGSLMDYNNGQLYVCGYITRNLGTGRHADYNMLKQAFVLRWDMSQNCIDLIRTYDWPGTNPSGNDYDMAHRMKFLSNGNIWVGGSCNAVGNAAMMNMVIDPVGLVPLFDRPILTPLVSDGQNILTSFDLSENLNRRGYSYIFGNYFTPLSSSVGMNPRPGNFNITAIDAATYLPVPGAASHGVLVSLQNANFWGTNTVKGNTPNSVILSGYQNTEKCGAQFTGNTYPFLVEPALTTGPAGNILIGTAQWSTILTAVGSNGFNALGGGLSNLVQGPITTVRDGSIPNGDIVLNAPINDILQCSQLNIKFVRTNNMLDPFCATESCETQYDVSNAWTSNRVNTSTEPYECITLTAAPDVLTQYVLDCANDGYYKPSSLNRLNGNSKTSLQIAASVFPNPAHDMIQVKLTGEINKNAAVKVFLSDIAGKPISTLFEGTADKVNNTLRLPVLPQGIYRLTVIYDHFRLQSESLTIY